MLRILHIAVSESRTDTDAVLSQVFSPYCASAPVSLSVSDEAELRRALCIDAKGCDLVVLTGDTVRCRKAVVSLTDARAIRPLTLTRRIAGWVHSRPGQLWVFLPDGAEKQTALLYECVLPLLPVEPEIVHTVGIYGLSAEALRERLAPFLSGGCPRCTLYRRDTEWRLRLTAGKADGEGMDRALADIRLVLGSYLYGVDCSGLPERVRELLETHSLTAAVTGMIPAPDAAGDHLLFLSKEEPVAAAAAPPDGDAGADEPSTLPLTALRVRTEGKASLGLVMQTEPSASGAVVRLSMTDGRRLWNKTLTGGDPAALATEAESALWDMTRRYLEAYPLVMAGGEPVALPEKPTDIPASPIEKEQPLLLRPVRRKSERAFRVTLVIVLCLVLCLSIGLFLYFRFFRRTPMSAFRDLEALYRTETSAQPSGEYPSAMLPQFYSLYKENNDIAGWIRLDNDQSYPVMNGFSHTDYSRSDFLGQNSSHGVPYFFPAVPRTDKNDCLIIYGNHMEDGTMFSCLAKYLDASYVRSHAVIEMNTIYRSGNWRVFSAFTLSTNDTDLNFTRTAFSDSADRLLFIHELQRRSKLNISSDAETAEELLLLTTTATASTADEQRIIVAFYRVDKPGSATVNVSLNSSAPRDTRTTFPAASTPDAVSEASSESSAEESRPSESSRPESEDGGTEFIEPSDEESDTPATTKKGTHTTATSTTAAVSTRPATQPEFSSDETEPSSSSEASSSSRSTTASATSRSTSRTTTPETGDYLPIRAGTIDESEYYPLFRLKNSATQKLFTPTTREELTLGLFYIVKMEMGSASLMKKSTEAQKAQAVASYSFVLYYCQNSGEPYTFKFPSYDPNDANDRKLYSAVASVAGIKMIYPDKPLKSQALNAMYCASSAGVTSTCHMVFTARLPYLVSVKSLYDTDTYLKTLGKDTITAQFTVKYGDILDGIGQKLDLARSEIYAEKGAVPLYATAWDGGEDGYVHQTNLYYYQNGKKTYIKGKMIRDVVNKYTSASMRSHAFTVTDYDSKTDVLTVQTRGYGHGLGMSQYGAAGYANEAGWTFDRILAHYYSITEDTPYQLVAPKF